MIRCYPSKGKRKAMKMCSWFALGVNRAPTYQAQVMDACHDYLLRGPSFFYGMTDQTLKLIDEAKRLGQDWYYADNAYYFGRSDYFRITRNRYMHDGCGDYPAERFERFTKPFHVVLADPEKRPSGHILITSQSDLFCRYQFGIGAQEWVAQTRAQIAEHTDREIKVCYKPTPPPPRQAHCPTFEEQLKGAHAVVTWSSSTAVKAIIDGIPAFTLGPAMCEPVANFDLSKIENPYFPNEKKRWQWLYNLAANQWTRNELRDGTAWLDLQNNANKYEGRGLRGRRRDPAALVGAKPWQRRHRGQAENKPETDRNAKDVEAQL
jgi:hypothetical protein